MRPLRPSCVTPLCARAVLERPGLAAPTRPVPEDGPASAPTPGRPDCRQQRLVPRAMCQPSSCAGLGDAPEKMTSGTLYECSLRTKLTTACDVAHPRCQPASRRLLAGQRTCVRFLVVLIRTSDSASLRTSPSHSYTEVAPAQAAGSAPRDARRFASRRPRRTGDHGRARDQPLLDELASQSSRFLRRSCARHNACRACTSTSALEACPRCPPAPARSAPEIHATATRLTAPASPLARPPPAVALALARRASTTSNSGSSTPPAMATALSPATDSGMGKIRRTVNATSTVLR